MIDNIIPAKDNNKIIIIPRLGTKLLAIWLTMSPKMSPKIAQNMRYIAYFIDFSYLNNYLSAPLSF